ncbi:MAG: ATP-dependent Clp protease proteolytic subunit [bacterium]
MTIGEILTAFFFAFLFILILVPLWRMNKLQLDRVRAMRKLEIKRGSRVITLIHRQEALSMLGLPFFRYIDMEDSEKILRAIRLTPPDTPIDLVVHTPGGLVLASEQIAHALRRHRGKVSMMVPHYAMSGGTLIALATEEILMDANAVLGPVDPQLQTAEGVFPATSLLAAVRQKEVADLEDSTLVMADVAMKAISQVRSFILWLLDERMTPAQAERIASCLAEGTWTHDAPLTVEVLQEIGLPIVVGLPEEVYDLMDLYPQGRGRRPSVQYIPIPYERKEDPKKS